MDAKRYCPECRSREYRFRGRRTVEVEQAKQVETKYRCADCSHEWKEREPPPPEKQAGRTAS